LKLNLLVQNQIYITCKSLKVYKLKINLRNCLKFNTIYWEKTFIKHGLILENWNTKNRFKKCMKLLGLEK
jgi:hypothetical protein